MSLRNRGLTDRDSGNNQNDEQNRHDDGNPEQSLFNAAPLAEHAAGIGAGKAAQADSLALQHNAEDQSQ